MFYSNTAADYLHLLAEPDVDARFREELARERAHNAAEHRAHGEEDPDLIIARSLAMAGNFIRFA